MDPRTAYQVVHMLEGVIIRGTGAALHDLGLPLFGKTGTTSGPTNVWFVGGSAKIVGGVYLGYDHPRPLGAYAQGATYAVPMFRQFVEESMGRWDHDPFLAPSGLRMVKIDRVSGQRVFGGTPSDDAKAPIIWEAFKPETEPQRPSRESQLAAKREDLLDAIRRGFAARSPTAPGAPSAEPALPQDFAAQQGGVY
jgi:penicillin-binding protein 1A